MIKFLPDVKTCVKRCFIKLTINTITMKDQKIIIGIFGKPGSGRSTLSEALKLELVDWFGVSEKEINLFSVGDLLHAEVEAGTPLGRKIKEPLAKNMLVPQKFINLFVRKYLEKHPAQISIIDGYPQDVGSVVYMQRELTEYSLAFVKSSVPDEIAARRLAAYKEKQPYIAERLKEYHEVVSPAWDKIVTAAPENHYVVDGNRDFDRAIRTVLRHILVNAR